MKKAGLIDSIALKKTQHKKEVALAKPEFWKNNHGHKSPKGALESDSKASSEVCPPQSGIVQLTNSDALHFRNWSFTNKRYYDLKSYWRNLFGCNVHKLPIDAGFTCPNRDGHVAMGGCIYCDGRGSKLRQKGKLPSVTEQIQSGKKFYKPHASKFIAYFQTFTNTYAPVEKLRALYDEALSQEDVIGLSIGTRPDCLAPEIIDLIKRIRKKISCLAGIGIAIHSR